MMIHSLQSAVYYLSHTVGSFVWKYPVTTAAVLLCFLLPPDEFPAFVEDGWKRLFAAAQELGCTALWNGFKAATYIEHNLITPASNLWNTWFPTSVHSTSIEFIFAVPSEAECGWDYINTVTYRVPWGLWKLKNDTFDGLNERLRATEQFKLLAVKCGLTDEPISVECSQSPCMSSPLFNDKETLQKLYSYRIYVLSGTAVRNALCAQEWKSACMLGPYLNNIFRPITKSPFLAFGCILRRNADHPWPISTPSQSAIRRNVMQENIDLLEEHNSPVHFMCTNNIMDDGLIQYLSHRSESQSTRLSKSFQNVNIIHEIVYMVEFIDNLLFSQTVNMKTQCITFVDSSVNSNGFVISKKPCGGDCGDASNSNNPNVYCNKKTVYMKEGTCTLEKIVETRDYTTEPESESTPSNEDDEDEEEDETESEEEDEIESEEEDEEEDETESEEEDEEEAN